MHMNDKSGSEDTSTAAAEDVGEGESLELNLRLDSDGRTISHLLPAVPKSDDDSDDDDGERYAKIPKLEHDTSPDASLDYSSKTIMTNFDSTITKQLDELLYDCEIADSGLLPRTFWIAANNNTRPRCYLEKMALEIFHHHVPPSVAYYYDPETSGAEWWVQIRPSPPTGRYSMHASSGADASNNEEDDMTKSGISFHWDKDEEFRLLTGGSMYIHPHLSTVTYLTDFGAPTMVLSKRVDPLSGSYITDVSDDGNVSNVEGFVSFPKQGKHLSFDGRYLHAAPSDLLMDGLFKQQCSFNEPGCIDKKELKVLERRHRRVSFLVNIWLNYKPFNVNEFPDTLISNLSEVDLFGDLELFGKYNEAKTGHNDIVAVKLNEVTKIHREDGSVDDEISNVVIKNWPMGNRSDECITIPMPVDHLRSCNAGDNVKLIWRGEDVKLSGTSA